MSNTETNTNRPLAIHDFARKAIDDHLSAAKRTGTGDCRTAYALLLAAEIGYVDSVSVHTLYAATDTTEKRKGIDALLVDVFETHEYYTTANKNTVAKLKEGVDERAESALKQSIRRMLPVVAYLYNNGGTDTVTISGGGKTTGHLVVPGWLIYAADKVEDNPALRDNKLVVGMPKGDGGIPMRTLIKASRDALGLTEDRGANANNADAATTSLARAKLQDVAADLEHRLTQSDNGDPIKARAWNADAREALRSLTITLCDVFGLDATSIDFDEDGTNADDEDDANAA